MRTPIRFLVAALLVATPALGQDKAAAPPKPDPTVAKAFKDMAKAAPPKPAEVLTAAFKDMAGTWSCSGSMDNPQAPGTQVQTRSEMRITPSVDGFAYTGVFKMEKNSAMPAGGKGMMQWGYDGGKNKLVELGFDNMGSTWQGTSDGEKDGTTVWSEEGTMMGQAMKSRTTVTRKGPKEITVTSEVDNKGAWQKMGEDTCKKK